MRQKAALPHFPALLVLSLLAAQMTPVPAFAASFNCNKGHAQDERAICADRRLNDLDVEMAVRLDIIRRLSAMGARNALMDDQLAWLKARHACNNDKSCLIRRYHDRMEEMNGALDRVYRRGPF